jgi:hypothetical protein
LSKLFEIGDPSRLNAIPSLSHGALPQKAIATNSLQKGDRGNLNGMAGPVLAHPVLDLGILTPRQPTLCAGIEKKRARRGVNHLPMSSYRLEDNAIQNRHLVVRESGEGILIGLQHFLTPFRRLV